MAELLAPAGNTEALDAAIREGADAVYLGLKSFNARIRSTNFAWSQFEAAVEALHRRDKKIFVTVNTVLQESETERMYRFLSYLNRIGPDGLIVQDLGVLNMVHTHFPKLRLHGSTQLNIASARGANALSRSGVSRVVLARELGLNEVQEIKMRTSCELEVFVHGALCVSESGLCLFSSYLGGKSANRGMCAQACRRMYSAQTPSGEKKGYFFSPHDLQLIDVIPDLVQAGVNSFKIEGRMKSAEYVGTVVAAYRYVLDNWESDKKAVIETAKRMLANDFARPKTRYWYDSSRAENILNPAQAGGTGIFLGNIARTRKSADSILALLGSGSGYTPDTGDSISLDAVNQPSLGTAVIDGDNVVYSSNGTAGTDTFGYAISDSAGNVATAAVTVNVNADVKATRTHEDTASPDSNFTVNLEIVHSGNLVALAINEIMPLTDETPPNIWQYVDGSVQVGTTRALPAVTQEGTDLLIDFGADVPASPISLSYQVAVPDTEIRDKQFFGELLYRLSGDVDNRTADIPTTTVSSIPVHPADTDGDGRVTALEKARYTGTAIAIVQQGLTNDYQYYIVGYSEDWESEPSKTVSVNTFLPSCPAEYPVNEESVEVENPTFQWTPCSITSFPYQNEIYDARLHFSLTNLSEDADKTIWEKICCLWVKRFV